MLLALVCVGLSGSVWAQEFGLKLSGSSSNTAMMYNSYYNVGNADIGNNVTSPLFTILCYSFNVMTVNSIVISGANASDFSVVYQSAINFPFTLDGSFNQTRTYAIKFTPSAAGTRSAVITINNNSTNYPVYKYNLRGGGNAPLIVISTQPVNSTACAGSPTAFSISTTGTGTVTYQWQMSNNGGASYSDLSATAPYSTVTSSTLNISDVTGLGGNYYRCVASDLSGTVPSNGALLTVNAKLSITTQPQNIAVCAGAATASLSVVAAGTGITYQWAKVGTGNIGGATSANYTINNPTVANAGNYTVTVSGSCSEPITSNVATINMGTTTSITAQPQNVSFCPGASTASLSVTANGSDLTYQWTKAGTGNIVGATAATYTINNPTAADAGDYTVTVSGACGSPVISNTAAISMGTTTSITTQPQNVAVCTGAATASLSVVAAGNSITYQWTKVGTGNIVGATSATYTINNPTVANAGNYTVTVSGVCGSPVTSNAATISMGTITSITTQPQNVTKNAKEAATFSVIASGTNLSYQWSKTGTGNINGATSNSYTINNLGFSNAGNYTVKVTGNCGTETSVAAILTVNKLAPAAITFAATVSKVYGDVFTETATGGGSANPVTFTSNNTLQATCTGTNGATVTALKKGTCTITANQLGDDYYNDAVAVNQTLIINPKSVTVTPTANQSKVYGNTEPTITYTVSPALINGDAFTGSLSRATGENVGSYAINGGTLNAGDNYTVSLLNENFAITKKSVTVTANAGQSKVYGQVDPVLTYTFTPALVSGDAFSGALARTTGENVGNYPINIGTLTVSNNYNLTFTGNNFTITSKPITITPTANQSKTYGDTDPVFTYASSSSLISGDSFTGNLSRVSGENVGNYAFAIGTLSAGTNYGITLTNENFAISPKNITVSGFTVVSKIYDGTTTAYFNWQTLDGVFAADVENVSLLAKGVYENKNVGTNKNVTANFSLEGSAKNNYNVSPIAGLTGEITQKALLLLDIKASSKEYDGNTNATLKDGTLHGIVAGDDVKLVLGTGTFADNIVGFAKVVTASGCTLSGNDGANYTIDQPKDLTADIVPRKINVIATTNLSKMFGDADPVLTYTFSPALLSGDVLTGALKRTTGENIGIYLIEIGTLTASSNYHIIYTGTTFTITSRTTIVTWNNPADITYGASLSSTQLNATANIEGKFTYTPPIDTKLNAGSAQELKVEFVPTDNVNFEVVTKTVKINVQKAPQTITFAPMPYTSIELKAIQSFNVTATASSGLPVSIYTDSLPVAWVSGNTVFVENEGIVNIIAAQNGSDNYQPAAVVTQQLTVTPSVVIVYTFSSPNDDGINDNWAIKNSDLLSDCDITVINSAGAKVFTSKGYDTKWDGSNINSNSKVPDGEYYYSIKGSKYDMKGTVVVMKNGK